MLLYSLHKSVSGPSAAGDHLWRPPPGSVVRSEERGRGGTAVQRFPRPPSSGLETVPGSAERPRFLPLDGSHEPHALERA
ncbi:[3-Methyl-2-Oxobutanoate Dehydrogenase [Lipoamide]] Kinase [Manis pentadactyla]|nr:[3-Methyl-2-Oxobutanoate Dehydrogenase [Lipoamide]] Kinase [Manis pentadactyla]